MVIHESDNFIDHLGPTAQSFAILASSFENAILLDPNVLPLQSLSTFLSSDSFKKNGILFFPAFNRPEPIDFYGKWTQEGKRRGGTTDTDMKMAQYQIRQFRHARQLIKPLVSGKTVNFGNPKNIFRISAT